MNKTVVKLFIAIIVALSAYGVYMNWRLNNLESELADVLVSKDSVSVLADSSRVREASTSLQRDSLKDALSAAEILNGKLVAAAKIKVKPRTITDTIIFRPDSGTERFKTIDTSATGVFEGQLTISPPPSFVQFGYNFTPNPFDLTVSLIQMRDNTAVFAVKARQCSLKDPTDCTEPLESSIEAPFAKLYPKQKFLSSYVEGLYNPFDKNAALRAGLQASMPFKAFLVLEGEQGFRGSDASNLYLGVRKVF